MIEGLLKDLFSSGPLGTLCGVLLIAVIILARELQKERTARIEDAKRFNAAGEKLLDAAANRAAARLSSAEDDK